METKYKLKNWVVICVYVMAIGAIISSLFLIGESLKSVGFPSDNLSYVYRGILNNDFPVVNFTNDKVIKPFIDEEVYIVTHYYDMHSDQKVQEKSLIKFGNTYMPNTGILYANKKEFDVICVVDGTIEEITKDEIMGNIVIVRHSNNLKTIYQSINEVNVLVGEEVKQGDIIGNSGMNKINTDTEFMLLFEVVYNGVNINPESFYQMDLKELS